MKTSRVASSGHAPGMPSWRAEGSQSWRPWGTFKHRNCGARGTSHATMLAAFWATAIGLIIQLHNRRHAGALVQSGTVGSSGIVAAHEARAAFPPLGGAARLSNTVAAPAAVVDCIQDLLINGALVDRDSSRRPLPWTFLVAAPRAALGGRRARLAIEVARRRRGLGAHSGRRPSG